MQHPDEGTIHAWLDGALSADEAATVEAHVNGCAQCQSTVAEARGFIAASSRILTALDNVPSGVVPVTKPKRRIDPLMWRIAATVLVVAAGTLVVVRNSSLETRSSARSEALSTAPVQDSASSKALETAATAAPFAAGPQAQVAAPAEKKAAAADRLRAIPPSASGVVGSVSSGNSREGRNETRNGTAPAPPSPVPAAAPAPRFQAMEGRANMSAMDAAAAEPVMRIVGTPRAIGQKITLYEVAPGDTVRLVEPLQTALDQTVVTAMGVTTQRADQARAATGAAAPTAKVAAPTDTTRPAAEGERTSAARRAPIGLRGSATVVESAAETNTISWTDSTGRVMKLSGRHTPAELEAIRRRIESSKASSTPATPCPSSDTLCRRR